MTSVSNGGLSRSRCIAAALSLLLLLPGFAARGAEHTQNRAEKTSLVDLLRDAHSLAIPIYATNSPRPVAIWRFGRVYQEYERRGFFRIGVLPIIAVENISLEVRDRAQLAVALDKAKAHLRTIGGSKRVLGRGFLVTIPAENIRVEAREARFESEAVMRLSDVVVRQGAGGPQSFRRAFFHLSGPGQGTLAADSAGLPVSIQLSAPSEPDSVTLP